MGDIDTVVVDSLKALDLERPIREAAVSYRSKPIALLDHLVGAREHGGGKLQAERLGGF